MIRRLRNASGLFLPALLLTAIPLTAQNLRPNLVLQTASGETIFHIGERIPLKLIFSSPNDAQYRIDSWRGVGRGCGSESVTVSPSTGWSDPTAVYFAQAEFGCGGSSGGLQPLLAAKPVARTTDLNQWVRFDQPGIYEVKISSGQVMEGTGENWTPVRLQSNTLELHIIAATPEWQRAKLYSIRGGLSDPSRPAYSDAEADVLYLATTGAIDEMTSSFRSTCCGLAAQFTLGLIGLPPELHDFAVESMEKHIPEADFPITGDFMYALSFLNVKAGSNAASIREQIQQSNAVIWRRIFSSLR